MPSKQRRRRPPDRSSGYRDPKPTPKPEPRRGFLDSLFAPRVPGLTPMPRIRTSFVRGIVTVMGSPVLVIAPIVFVYVFWVTLVAAGYQGPFAPLVSSLALPPVGSGLDLTLATSLFGAQGGLVGVLVLLVVRAVVLAFLTAAVVEVLDAGKVSAAGLRRGLRALPTTFATCIIGVGILTISIYFAPVLGPGFGILIQFGGLALGIYLFAFAPIIAVEEGRSMPDALSRSVRAARMPGAGNASFAALYIFVLYIVPAIAVTAGAHAFGNLIGVNPTVWAWLFVLVVNLMNVAFLATFAFRYLSIAHEVPDAPARSSRTAAARGGRR